jgi:hypothetical protein
MDNKWQLGYKRKLWTTNGLGRGIKIMDTKGCRCSTRPITFVHPPKIDSKPCECFYLNSKLQPMGRWYHAACDSLGVKENYGQLNGSLVIKEYYGQQMAAWV